MRFAPAIGGEQLLFDFDKFSSITESVYADSPYSLAEVLEMFRYYFEQYEAYTGAPHPPIRAVQIERIIHEMPYIDETDKANSTMDIDPDCYDTEDIPAILAIPDTGFFRPAFPFSDYCLKRGKAQFVEYQPEES